MDTVREGFQAEERPKPAPRPQQQVLQPEKKKLVLETPPPEMVDSPAQQDEASPATPAEVWPIVVKLIHKPISNERLETVHELIFREPRGGDINRFGNPVRINQDGEVIIEERKMHWMMSALCGISPPRLEALDPRDWNSCAYRLRSFFLPDPAAW